ncbi:hypothetical protein BDN72DRAFT_845117 [Pluteus cervinus]|uniref:Uncharacterized protein n=1 Tax=Pluteus cervinus TaxID=181527 RepID=A0ACD3AJ62_9AGAR|nr:hypothetical protein BDN72DRAFT_845117 [Pluteus cervinus]
MPDSLLYSLHNLTVKSNTVLGDLPPEIWREIVEISSLSSLSQAAKLTQVSKSFQIWITPILLRTAVHYSEYKGWPRKRPSLSWFQQNGTHLRNLLWGIGSQMGLLVQILEECPALENLAVWVYIPSHDTGNVHLLRPVLSKLRLRQLSINPFALFSTDIFGPEHAKDPMFTSITYFHIISDIIEWRDITGLAHIPTITHLAFQYHATRDAVCGALEHCKSLKVLIVLRISHDSPPKSEFPPNETIDERFVIISLRTILEWEDSAMGKKGCWDFAEEEISNRRKSEDELLSIMWRSEI